MPNKDSTKASEEEQFVAHFQAASGLLARMLYRAVAVQAIDPRTIIANTGSKGLTVKEAAEYLGIGKTSFYKLVRSDLTFPDPVEISPGIERYLESSLDAWRDRKQEGG